MATQAGDEVRNLGSRLELFVDDWLIQTMQGVGLKMHSPTPREVILELNRPWEGSVSYDPVVIKEDDRYRFWYRGCGEVWEDQVTGYAESLDGIHWYRPDLGIFEFNGSKENNIVLLGSMAKALCVFRDGNPNAPDSERYKAIGVGKGGGRGKMQRDQRGTLRAFASPDGLRWQVWDQDPLLIAPDDEWPMFDSHNVAFWDTEQEQYVIYARGWFEPGIRSIRRCVSPDLRQWSEFELIDMGDSPPEHLYKNACTQYFRAPHIYLMFPKRFVPDRQFHPDEVYDKPGLSESVFMTSRDGQHWDRRFMEAFIRPGPDPENWTDRNMYTGVGVVPTSPTEVSLYYLEHYQHPSCRIRRGTLRTDGFVSMNAPYAGGEFVTKPLTFTGGELAINYATSVAGSVRVEVQDANGQPVPGFALDDSTEMYGDEIEAVVRWQSGSSVVGLAGQPIRLRFVLKDADIYALRFQP